MVKVWRGDDGAMVRWAIARSGKARCGVSDSWIGRRAVGVYGVGCSGSSRKAGEEDEWERSM
jgi:hypothetical protein